MSAPGIVKGLFGLALALLGFVSANALASRFLAAHPELRLPPGSSERQKLAEYRRHTDDYDTLFIGTSRVLRGIDPRVFDRRMAELGRPTRSYNFGLNGMGFLEQLHLVDWILDQHRAGGALRWLFIEPTERDAVMRLVGKDAHKVNLFTMRSVYWHGTKETELGIRATWGGPRRFWKKVELTRLHLLHMVHRLCGVGVGVNLLNVYLQGDHGEPLVAGFSPRDPTEAEWVAADEQGHREPAAAKPADIVVQFMAQMAASTSAAGVEPVFVMPPTPQPPALSLYLDAHDWKAPARLMHYSKRNFPEILAGGTRYFYDEGHLNLSGAELFTHRLATDFAALLEGQ